MTGVPRHLYDMAMEKDPRATMAAIETWEGSDMTDQELLDALRGIAEVEG